MGRLQCSFLDSWRICFHVSLEVCCRILWLTHVLQCRLFLPRKAMQACCIRQHENNFVHKVAMQVYLSPDRPVSQCLPHSIKNQALFNDNVPQPSDWLRAWRACQTASSFVSAAQFFSTDDFIAGRPNQMSRRRVSADTSQGSTVCSLRVLNSKRMFCSSIAQD